MTEYLPRCPCGRTWGDCTSINYTISKSHVDNSERIETEKTEIEIWNNTVMALKNFVPPAK